MDRIVKLLADAKQAGLSVRAEGGLLVIRGPRQAEPLAQLLLADKAAVLAALAAQNTSAVTEEIESKPALMLNYLFEKVWKIQPVRRDHPHNDPQLWIDEPPKAGRIRTHCKLCGDLIGYRPSVAT